MSEVVGRRGEDAPVEHVAAPGDLGAQACQGVRRTLDLAARPGPLRKFGDVRVDQPVRQRELVDAPPALQPPVQRPPVNNPASVGFVMALIGFHFTVFSLSILLGVLLGVAGTILAGFGLSASAKSGAIPV